MAVLRRANPGGLVVNRQAKIPLNSAGGGAVAVTPGATLTPSGPGTVTPAQRLTFEGGATTASKIGIINMGERIQYVLTAAPGQTLTINLQAPANEVTLGVNDPNGIALNVDMHDVGDLLVHAGFADPVMDQEHLTLHWPGPRELLAELRSLGGNLNPARHRGLRTPRWRSRLEAALRERADATGRIALGFEIVYGHAFVATPRVPVAPRTEVPLADLRAMARRGRGA